MIVKMMIAQTEIIQVKHPVFLVMHQMNSIQNLFPDKKDNLETTNNSSCINNTWTVPSAAHVHSLSVAEKSYVEDVQAQQ